MLNGKRHRAVFSEESPETRERMRAVFDAYEKLERELRQHLQQLLVARWEREAASLRLLSIGPK
jgi:hypothetical protein